MAYENIRLEKRDSIAIVTIDRPKVLNALNMPTMTELRHAFTELRDDVETRVVLLTGEMIPAQEATRLGLWTKSFPAAKWMKRAEEIARKIIANAPLAVQYTMEAVKKAMAMPLAEGLFLEATLFSVACATEDKKEGTTAFLEKRPANFKGK